MTGAIGRGLSPRAAFLAVLVGAVVLVVIAVGQGSRAGLRPQAEPTPVPPGAVFDPTWKAALLACVPSTLGVAAMCAASLAFSPALAAVLAGVLLSLGGLALVAGAELVAHERREGVRLFVGRGPTPVRYVAPRTG